MNRLLRSVIIGVATAASLVCLSCRDGTISVVGRNDWKVFSAVNPSDSLHTLRITYCLKDEADTHIVACMAVFENTKTGEYLIDAPWMEHSITIRKSDLVFREVVLINKATDTVSAQKS